MQIVFGIMLASLITAWVVFMANGIVCVVRSVKGGR